MKTLKINKTKSGVRVLGKMHSKAILSKNNKSVSKTKQTFTCADGTVITGYLVD